MNKRLVFGFSLVLVLLSVSVFVSAASSPVDELKSVGGGVVDLIKPIFESLLGETSTGTYFFAKVLFLLIIFSIVWVTLGEIDLISNKTWVLILISSAVSILGVRYIEIQWIQTILLPYSVFGIAVAAGLPFVLYFIMVEFGMKSQSGTLRKIMWAFFIVIFIGLWYTRKDEIAGQAEWVYPATALLAFIMMLLDGTIQKALSRAKAQRAHSTAVSREVLEFEEDMDRISKLFARKKDKYSSVYGHAGTGIKAYEEDMKYLRNHLAALQKA